MILNNDNLKVPAGLSPIGHAAAETIINLLDMWTVDVADTGTGRVLYSPAEWEALRDEPGHGGFGIGGELVIVHRTGDHLPWFHDETLWNLMQQELAKIPAVALQATDWHTTIWRQ